MVTGLGSPAARTRPRLGPYAVQPQGPEKPPSKASFPGKLAAKTGLGPIGRNALTEGSPLNPLHLKDPGQHLLLFFNLATHNCFVCWTTQTRVLGHQDPKFLP